MIHETRLRQLNPLLNSGADTNVNGRYVLYWMQAAQRSRQNHALEFAIRRANTLSLPVVVVFGLMKTYPEANARHYAFMLSGLKETAADLQDRGIAFVIRFGSPDSVAIGLARDAALVVTDRNDLRLPRQWRDTVAQTAPCPVIEVETDVIVPVDVASHKHETQARTLRPRIHRHLADYLQPLDDTSPENRADQSILASGSPWAIDLVSDVDLSDPTALALALPVDQAVRPVRRLVGGRSAALERLDEFLDGPFKGYGSGRNEPGDFRVSYLSPYLHFGQISALEIALAVQSSRRGSDEDRRSYLEELIIRRELTFNFVRRHPDTYDSLSCLPGWATKTLAEHKDDIRNPSYTLKNLETAQTHDPYWNAAMREMVHTGFMHNYMRMYWGKKIIEWSPSPEEAFDRTLYLNNKFFLDGRDPNSYGNVLWIYGLHDRAWTERPIFGKTRYMAASGLERKFDMKAYVRAVDSLVDAERI